MVRRLPLALCACCLFLFAAACGGGDDGSSAPIPGSDATPTTYANNASAAPQIGMPSSRYSVLQSDLDPGYLTDVPGTFVLTAENYSPTATFPSPEEGLQKLAEWGYLGGYETGYTPEGRDSAVLNGSYYIFVETHLFETPEGTAAAFDYFNDRLTNSVSEQVTAPSVGNESAAWRLVYDTIGNSSVESVFHRVIFRRGNMLVVVATLGAEPLMKVDDAYSLAVIVDEKAMGARQAPEPTPTGGG